MKKLRFLGQSGIRTGLFLAPSPELIPYLISTMGRVQRMHAHDMFSKPEELGLLAGVGPVQGQQRLNLECSRNHYGETQTRAQSYSSV